MNDCEVFFSSSAGDENRASHKDNISQVLRAFGECEAYLKKSAKCLHEVEAKINYHFNEETWETVEEKALHDEIEGIIKIIGGKPQSGGYPKYLGFLFSSLDIDTPV